MKNTCTADPVSAVLIYKGIKTFEGLPIDIDMVDSDFHVFTRLNLREKISARDSINQMEAFEDFVVRVQK